MRILIQNEYGSFEIGGGTHPMARLEACEGLGIVARSVDTVTFADSPGSRVQSVRDSERVITLGFDFFGGEREVMRLYSIIYHPVDILFYIGDKRRKISGMTTAATQTEKIVYHKWQKVAVQFTCHDPYFHDILPVRRGLASKTDLLPNVQENDVWYVELPAVATVAGSEAVVINRGDTMLYPTLYIQKLTNAQAFTTSHGIVITNRTTGKTIELLHEVIAGEVITVDLARRKITSPAGGNITDSISDDTVLSDFYLVPGDNDIVVESLNIADVLAVDIEYNNNYAAIMI